MVKAYEELEMYDLRDDAERVMRINFPESRFLMELPEVKRKHGGNSGNLDSLAAIFRPKL